MSEAESPPARPHAEPVDPYVGTVIGDRYLILERIGEGGMGLVYRAEHMLMKKIVAIKLLHRELGEREDAVRRFEREAQSTSRLNHPSVVAVTDFGKAATSELFLVMEYVGGDSLATVIEREGRFSTRRALAVTRLILQGLEHAHAAGVVHRDLKPANIMMVRNGAGVDGGDGVKILDFGIAKLTSDEAAESGELTQTGMIFGTPSYMSPEQATGQDSDARADLYACGIILYELLAGRKPFVSDDLVKVMAMQVTAVPPALARVAPGARIPVHVEAVLAKALEKDRNRRFQTASEFLAALDEPIAQSGNRLALARAWTRAQVQRLRAFVDWIRADKRRTRIALGTAGVVAALLVLPMLFSRTPKDLHVAAAPKPIEPALREPVKLAEEDMAHGRLPEARALLLQQLSKHPDSGRVRFMLGTLDFIDKNPTDGLVAYAEALRLDPGLRSDATLLFNVRPLLDDRKLGREALDLLIKQVGRPAADSLATVATEDHRADFRKDARDACRTLGCLGKVDLVQSYSQDLAQAKTCAEKREAVHGLGATQDKRAIDVLKKTRRDRGGPFGLFNGGGNECVRKDVDQALNALGVGTPKPRGRR